MRSAHADVPCEQLEAELLSTCFSRQHTHACAPMEPLYGPALVAIPSLTAFLAFGGRAAVDMVEDFSECSERLGRLAWRFQYHTQLTETVQLDVNGATVGVAQAHHIAMHQPETAVTIILTRGCISRLPVNADYQCLNQPIVGLLKTPQEPGGDHTSHSHSTTSSFEPATHAYNAGTHVEWARLIPFGMLNDSMQQLLHRSHHAMVPIQTNAASGQAHPKLFLLWGGYGQDMGVVNDMWAVYVYEPGSCTALKHAGSSWWADAWCFTAFQIRQTGAVPPGRAYAKLAVLQVFNITWVPAVFIFTRWQSAMVMSFQFLYRIVGKCCCTAGAKSAQATQASRIRLGQTVWKL